MVSFQCNGCGDVLTKPKLDKHRAVCHSPFDCIDCSKRFESPADYKGHTSCISEAEKYQKTLYNGGSGPGRDNRNQRSWQQGGGSQRGNHRPQWQRRDVNRATGANDTPLGTPIRMSPVNDAPVVKEDVQKDQLAVKTSKKREAEFETTESKDTSEPSKKKKKQKTAGRGAETIEANVSEAKSETKRKPGSEVTITERTPHGPSSQPAEDGNEKRVEKKEKEKRKKKEESILSGQQETVARSVKKKSKLKEPESKLKAAAADRAAELSALAKSPQSTTSDVLGMTRDDPGGRKKKRRSGNHQKDDSDGKLGFEGNGGPLKEKPKEKRKKRKSQSHIVNVVE